MAAGGNLELPHRRDGGLDYDTLGKMVTAHILGEVLYASFIDPKHSKKTPIRADTDWEYCYEKNHVVVLKKKSQSTCFMGRGVINKPLKDLADFYEDIESTFLWDHLLVDARYVRHLSKSVTHADYIGYQVFETRQYCGFISLKRDMLYYVRCIHTDDGKYVQSGVSIEDPEFPIQTGVPRVDLHFGSGFVLEKYGSDADKTLISYLADFDVKQLPTLIMKQVLKRHPMSIHMVRNYFSNPVSSHQRKQSSDKHKYQTSVVSSSSLSPLKHSSKLFEEDTRTNDFLGLEQTSVVARRPSAPPSVLSSEPLCFSTVHGLDKHDS